MLIKSMTTLQTGSAQQGFSYGFVLSFHQEKLDSSMANGVCIHKQKNSSMKLGGYDKRELKRRL